MTQPTVIGSGIFGGASFGSTGSFTTNMGTGNNRVLVVFAAVDDGAPASITLTGGVVGATAMTLHGTTIRRYGTTNNGLYACVYLGGATLPTGTQTCTVTYNDPNRKPFGVWAVFDNADAVTKISNITLSNSGVLSQSAAVTSEVGSLAVAMVISDSPNVTTAGGDSTLVVDTISGTGLRAILLTEPGAASNTINWTHTVTTPADARLVFSINALAADVTAPIITGPGSATGSTSSVSISENTTAVHTFTSNEIVTWDLNGGSDVSKFSINPSTGALSFITGPDFEIPTDANTDNVYVVGVRATDASLNATTQTVSVTVSNVVEADATVPVMTGSLNLSLLTTTSYTLSWSAATDNVGVTGYELSLNGGSTWTNLGNVLTTNISGRTSLSTDSCRVRAYDAALNYSSPLLRSVTLSPSEVVTEPLENLAGSLHLNAAVKWTWWPLGRLGAMEGIVAHDGSDTTHPTTGVLTIRGLPVGPGILMTSIWGGSANQDSVHYHALTVV